jgi:hypothetical protein
MKIRSKYLVRASISFPPNTYRLLERLAKMNKVSLAWVVRDAAEKYLSGNGSRKALDPGIAYYKPCIQRAELAD